MIRPIPEFAGEPVPHSLLPEGASRGLSLDALEPGEQAVITGVEGAPAVRRRLLEAGFVAGSRVRFLMATPFGDPMVFHFRGASIALRKTEARCVRVKL